ncbi:MAG: hypothetical protein KDA78_19010, partial [Planctomycetaceae bacterium]|nr:hypothetical protein [Planctomycetaceae bacterium]
PLQRSLRIGEEVKERPASASNTFEKLKTSREKMLSMVEDYEKLCQCLRSAEASWKQVAQAHTLLSAGQSIRPRDFGLSSSDPSEVKRRFKQTNDAVNTLRLKMLTFEDLAEARITAALQLINVPKVMENIEGGEELRLDIRALLPTAQLLSYLMMQIPDLVLSHQKLGALLSRLNRNPPAELIESIKIQIRDMHNTLSRMHDKMGNHVYPTSYGEKTFKIQEYALPSVPGPEDLFPLLYVTEFTCGRLMSLQIRLFSKLTYYAEKIETFVKLPKLEKRVAPQRSA